MDPAQFQYLRERQFQEEGRYFVAVTVNQQAVSGQWLEFRYHPQQKRLLPWVNRRQWLIWGLPRMHRRHFAETENTAPVADITALVGGVSLSFDSASAVAGYYYPATFFLTKHSGPQMLRYGNRVLLHLCSIMIIAFRGTVTASVSVPDILFCCKVVLMRGLAVAASQQSGTP